MPESDVTKMKVADLKRELKLRGLPLNGNKNELQDRLQTALLEGDISLDDSAIADAIVDAIDDDVSLTDEDEHKLLGDDHEDLLLKSPVSTPTATTIPDLSSPTGAGAGDSKADINSASLPAKKIVLKRNNSQLLGTTVSTATTMQSKENAAPEASGSASESEEKPTKTLRKPIVVGGKDSAAGADKKLSELSIQERLEMRAKKFGIAVDAKAAAAAATTTVTAAASSAPKAAAAPAINKSSSASIKANKGNKETDEQQKEALKRRAERFGCVVPEKTPKTLADERLQKRKERFGGAAGTATAPTDVKGQGEWAEKARARLERFKGASAVADAVAADATK